MSDMARVRCGHAEQKDEESPIRHTQLVFPKSRDLPSMMVREDKMKDGRQQGYRMENSNMLLDSKLIETSFTITPRGHVSSSKPQ